MRDWRTRSERSCAKSLKDNFRKFKRWRDAAPEYPIYVQNATDRLIEWKMYDQYDFIVREHPCRRFYNIFCIWPGQVVNLREVMTDQPFHSSMHLHWLIERERLIVMNEACWGYDPDEDPSIPGLKELAANPPPKRSARHYAVMATRRKNELRHPENTTPNPGTQD